MNASLKLVCSQIGSQPNLDGAKLAGNAVSLRSSPIPIGSMMGISQASSYTLELKAKMPPRVAVDYLREAGCRKTS
jgi:hypothetical protein